MHKMESFSDKSIKFFFGNGQYPNPDSYQVWTMEGTSLPHNVIIPWPSLVPSIP